MKNVFIFIGVINILISVSILWIDALRIYRNTNFNTVSMIHFIIGLFLGILPAFIFSIIESEKKDKDK